MTGLTNEQVNERISQGQINKNENPNTRTYKQIIRENTLTFFNFLNVVLLVLVLFVGSYKNTMFMGVIVINTVIGIIQEVRAKRTLDKLAILTESKTVVLRDGKKWSIATDKLVLDDIIFLKTGEQVPADVRIVEGNIEVNESLLTGEADSLSRNPGDELFSGSFITSGEACCQVIHVGKDNYASKITSEAKEFRRHRSELRNSLNIILKVISIIIVPLGIVLFYKQHYIVGDTLEDSVVSTVAAVLGMIPEGLVLLTSVALTLGSLVLARKKTLVQELYCIETLARVDTLCLDKTGTITEGSMHVEKVVSCLAEEEEGSGEPEAPADGQEGGSEADMPAQPVPDGDSAEGRQSPDLPLEEKNDPALGEEAKSVPMPFFLPAKEKAPESGGAGDLLGVSENSEPGLIKEALPGTAEVSRDAAAQAGWSAETEGKTLAETAVAGSGEELTQGETAASDSAPEPFNLGEIERIMGNLTAVLRDENATADALRNRFSIHRDMTLQHAIPFSSDRKYSGAVFESCGTYLMGAVQFLFPKGQEELKKLCRRHARSGYRVLVLAHSAEAAQEYELPAGLRPLALFLLTDVIREEAPDTLAFFERQGVDLKVISGDDPGTVSAVAKKAGLKNADKYIDASDLTTQEQLERAVKDCSVFGRVTPQQKKAMVQALKKQGHTVAMTGDGVNDVLALKEADCSVAMAQGSEAAKNIANVVLLDSNFASMPHIVNQGRRVVNNIRTAASMFLIKTIFSVLLSLLTIFFGDAYPFEPIQMSLISACAVGIPTFLLAQENNYDKIDHTFLRHVFMNAFPAAVTISGCVFAVMLVCQGAYEGNSMLNTACVLVTGWNYMAALKTVYAPLNHYRKIVIYGMQVAFFSAAVIFQNLLSLGSLEFGMIILVFILMTFSPVVIDMITEWVRRMYARSLDKENPGKAITFIENLEK